MVAAKCDYIIVIGRVSVVSGDSADDGTRAGQYGTGAYRAEQSTT